MIYMVMGVADGGSLYEDLVERGSFSEASPLPPFPVVDHFTELKLYSVKDKEPCALYAYYN